EDKDYGGTDSYGAAFDVTGHLFTVAYDGHLRRYGPDFRLALKAKAQGGARPFSIAVHPAGDRLAVGLNDTTAVEVYDSRNLTRVFAADTVGVGNGNLSKVAWSADGARLFAGGRYQARGGDSPIRLWDQGGRGRARDVPVSQSTIMQLLPCGAGLAVGATDPAFGLLSTTGEKRLWQTDVTADMRGKREDAFTLSAEGRQVRFGLGYGGQAPVLFDVATQRLTDAPSPVSGLSAADTTSLKVSDWQNVAPKLDGAPLALQQYEWSFALAIAPDRARFVLGTNWRLRAYDRSGKELWQKQVPDVAWGVNITGNGKLIATAYGDGTIRWHRLDDGRELLALFVHAKDRRWVAWTPKGYYTASAGGEGLIGWHVNRGWDNAADFFPAAQFRDRFYRPDIVQQVLRTLDEDKAVAAADADTQRRRDEASIVKRLPPVVTILSPADGATFSTTAITVEYAVRSPSGQPVTRVRALIDNRPAEGAETKGFIPVGSGDTSGRLEVTGLPARSVTLSVIAEAGELASTPASIRLTWAGASKPKEEDLRKGKLYALLVGVGKYKDKRISGLNWAGQDARDLETILKGQKGPLYRDVETRLLSEQEATRDAIIDGLEWLKRSVSQGDVGLLFLSGHGATDERHNYFFVPHDAELDADAGFFLSKRSKAIPDTEIQHALKSLRGHALFLFDTCHAGRATGMRLKGDIDLRRVIAELASSQSGVFVLSSSDGAELSHERDEWKNGAVTKALKEGLQGAADIHPKDGVVSIDELALFVKERVKQLTDGRQHPVDLRPQETRNIPVAVVR
ncbi:MAG: hypothetical protein ACREC6_11955, partial [Hyphomicrobiaceae bacterium]